MRHESGAPPRLVARATAPRRSFATVQQVPTALRAVPSAAAYACAAALPTLGWLVAHRPRYLGHGTALAVGAATLAAVALQPRPSGILHPDQAVAAQPTAVGELAAGPPAPAPAPPPEPTAAPAPAKPRRHAVAEGETLRTLAAQYGVNVETILWANDLADPDLVQIGQELVILPTNGVLHTVRPGETLRMVAEWYGVETADVLAANDLGPDPDLVHAGTQLVIPGGTPRPGTPADASAAQGDGQQQSATTGATARRAVPSPRTYEVQPGDTLRGIAEKFGVDVTTILSSNGVADPDTIKPGSELRILPVKGIEYTVQPDETLAEIAWKYQVDLGLLLDYNDLDDPDMIRAGLKLVVPGGKLRPEAQVAPAPAAPGPVAPVIPVPVAPKPPVVPPAPVVPKPEPVPAPAPPPVGPVDGAGIVANALKYLGHRYVFGGTSPAGFDCSGFVYYVHRASGAPVGRGMWQQYNGGAHIPLGQLQPGDTVFFANTYMPGLSHDGIYLGDGRFVHASDERSGVTISSLSSGYWASRYVGATRLWR
jgi:LysM repeat protein